MNSPFHEGEISLQKSLGIDQRMDKFGRKVIRDFMPEQHRKFYSELPYIFLGHQDQSGEVWASLLAHDKKFISSPNDKELVIEKALHPADPLCRTLESGSIDIGLLGINLENRRRNRLSTRVTSFSNKQLQLRVKQSFGNCPKFISKRKLIQNESYNLESEIQQSTSLSKSMRDLISQADTFFVASTSGPRTEDSSSGADISHRGGSPGFIQIEDDSTLCIPDYAGNGHFNTLGNFLLNPHAGLLFIDFVNSHILSMTGTAKVMLDDPKTANFPDAERLWRFHLTKSIFIPHALPYKWEKL
jgi:predicted pyridoxine 5'-phosphate oxidase superfamily flavin-nucleotide-binding protein